MNAFTGLIKGQAFLEDGPGLVPGYSASGQDVWVPRELSRGMGPGIVLSSVGARCGKTFLADAPVWGTVANTSSWGISPSWYPRFVHYVLNREDFWIRGGSAQPYVQIVPSLSQPVALLSKSQQIEIAKFLDRETAQIDDLITKQERLIEVLAEKRQAIITHAVTKGLDPNAPTKPSGVPWLGDVPMHWSVRKFGQVTTINGGQVDPREEPWASMLLIAPNHVESGTGKITYRETAAEQGADSGKYLVKSGEVIYSKIRPIFERSSSRPKTAYVAQTCTGSALDPTHYRTASYKNSCCPGPSPTSQQTAPHGLRCQRLIGNLCLMDSFGTRLVASKRLFWTILTAKRL